MCKYCTGICGRVLGDWQRLRESDRRWHGAQSGHLFVVECATRILSVVATDGAMVLRYEINVSHQTTQIPPVD
jgi:hypothetical protein